MRRYAVYYAPRGGPFSDQAARWLNGDANILVPAADAKDLTTGARRYGFHGTLRAPFRPLDGISHEDIARTLASLAARLAPVQSAGLQVENLDGFLALTPLGDTVALVELAAQVVVATNDLRAPLTEAEIARRRPESLTLRQRKLLDDWGYPFVMEEFRFHLTLTDRLSCDDIAPVANALEGYFAPVLPQPFQIEDLCLFGEDADGAFHLLDRYSLTG